MRPLSSSGDAASSPAAPYMLSAGVPYWLLLPLPPLDPPRGVWRGNCALLACATSSLRKPAMGML